MAELITIDDFSAGWIPSDDPLKGRRNGLLKMDSLELDQNGAVRMGGGTARISTVFTNQLHSLQRILIAGTTYSYSGDTSGNIFRNNTNIGSSGSTARVAINSAYNYAFVLSGNLRKKDTGSVTTDLGIVKPTAGPVVAAGSAGVLTGSYEYCQINVFTNGSYQGKSARSLITTAAPTAQVVGVTPEAPSVADTQANEAWIFRRGGTLETWYRIARVLTPFSAFNDNMTDSDAVELNIGLNDYLLSLNSTDTPAPILECVGPVYGRMLYFTATQIIIGDINSPDSYDIRTVRGITAIAGSETFLWAIKISKNNVLVGTNKDVYTLTGTYIQLPDGFMDVTLMPLGVDNPPISVDVALYGNAAAYISKIGPVLCGLSGETIGLAAPNLDRIFQGEAIGDYGTIAIDASGAIRYPVAILKNKFYCVLPFTLGMTTTYSMLIYDFIRQYWHNVFVAPSLLTSSPGSSLHGFDPADKFIKRYDNGAVHTLDDGSSTNQLVAMVTTFQDGGRPRNRKDLYTLTIRGLTGSASLGLTVRIAFDGSTSYTTLSPVFKGVATTEVSWDISGGITDPGQLAKCVQVSISGQVPYCVINDISISCDLRPTPELHLNLQDLGLNGIESSKVSTLNFLLDTGGADVDFYPVVDGTVQTKSTFNTSKKRLCTHYFTGSVAGFVLTGYFVATTQIPFEFYQVLPAGVVQKFPELRKFQQAGPLELWRYGKLLSVFLRINPVGTQITGTIYDQENVILGANTITVVAMKDQIYELKLPKTTAGSVIRVELISTSPFMLYSCRAKVSKSGKDTENEIVNLAVDHNNATT